MRHLLFLNLLLLTSTALAQQPARPAKHSPQLAIWLGLGAAFLGLLTTFFSVWAAKRQQAAKSAKQPGSAQAQ